MIKLLHLSRFLNDLLDADVLLHIIDISGCTNEKGEEVEGYDPAQDVHWLQQELQYVLLLEGVCIYRHIFSFNSISAFLLAM